MKIQVLFGCCAGLMVLPLMAEGDRELRDERGMPHRYLEKGEGRGRMDDGKRDEREGKAHRERRERKGLSDGMLAELDKDGDGLLSKQEFFALPRMAKLSEEARDKIFKRFDTNGDDSISPRDIRELHDNNKRRKERELRALDKDGSGGVSFVEFSAGKFFSKLPAERREQIFKRMDTDGDGEITPEDKPLGPPKPHRRKSE